MCAGFFWSPAEERVHGDVTASIVMGYLVEGRPHPHYLLSLTMWPDPEPGPPARLGERLPSRDERITWLNSGMVCRNMYASLLIHILSQRRN